MTTPAPTREIIVRSFFSLAARERLPTRDGTPVELSTWVFYILVTLLSHPNEVIGKSDLMNQVWQGVTVEEGSLCFHIANLRKVLGDGKNGTRYITTASGGGYCFVAPVAGGEKLARMNLRNCLSTPSTSSPLSGPEVSDNAGGRNRAPADERNSFVYLQM